MTLFTEQPTYNPAQQQAIDARQGYFACVAGPGSGKTKVLVARYQALRDEGVPASDILAMTFTTRAAKEMRERATVEPVPGNERPSGFCTFHSLGLAFANLERESFPFELAPQPLASAGQIAKYLGVASRRYQLKYKELANWVSEQKRLGLGPKDVLAIESYRMRLRDAYRDYDSMMSKNGLLDFDDLILHMNNLLNGSILARWQYKYLMIDEAQDADEIQWQVVQRLSSFHKNVFSVGDCNQTIYTWRGARHELFLEFEKMFPGAKTIYLGTNYRSSPEIVSLVKKLAPIKNALLDSFCSISGSGSEPVITKYNSPLEEAQQVITAYQGGSWGTAAVLARTNAQLRGYEELCAEKKVPYHLLGKSGYWAQPEIKHVLSYCQVAHAPYDAAILGALAAPFHPARFINKRDLKLALAAREGSSYWDAFQYYRPENEQQAKAVEGFWTFLKGIRRYDNDEAQKAVMGIMLDLKAPDYYRDEEENPDNDPVENLKQLVKISQRFARLGDFLAYCRKITHASRRTNGLALGTIHASKGLEFDTVFVVGVAEGLIPHEKSDNIEEEARLLFVACSRPARNLFISYSGQPSRFLTQAGLI